MTQSVDERLDVGRAARAALPREALAELHTPADRADPVTLLQSQATSRIAELVPIRYGRMLLSPFSFYRGAALVMAADLAAGPHTGLIGQLCGDAHLSNFGLFGTPERNLVFDVNDFDETLPGPWEWDVKRLVASLAIAGRANGFPDSDREHVVRSCASGYRTRMQELASMGELAAWYTQTTIDEELQASVDNKFAKAIQQTAAKARTHDSLQAVSKLTETVDGQSRLISQPPLLVPIEELVGAAQAHQYEQQMEPFMQRYRDSLQDSRRPLIDRFRYVAMARKVVGVGSVGLRSWIMLLVGRDNHDPLLLQMKEAQPSVLERFLGASEYSNAPNGFRSGSA